MTSKLASVIFPILLMTPLTGVAQQYTATDIGTLGGSTVSGTGINASGQVTGFSSTTGNRATHAFVFSAGTMQDLGTLGGTTSQASGINASGQVTGFAQLAGDTAQHAFIYSNGVMQDLGTLGGANSGGNGINDSGEVTGFSETRNGSHAFLYSDGSLQDLGTLPTVNGVSQSSTGNAINASGQVAGYSSVPQSNLTEHAFLFSDGSLLDLGTFGAIGTELNSQGLGINASGQVTGFAELAPQVPHAFIYSNGSKQDLGTLGGTSEGFGINASGQVTGVAILADGVTQHAFLYSNGKMVDLNSLLSPSQASVITLMFGRAINDSGQIVADGHDSTTSQNATFLLTPSNATAPVITLSTGSLTFSNQSVNTSSPAQTVRLTNNGTAALGLGSISVMGPQADDFNLASACGASLAVSASCTVSISFRPVSVGSKKASISIKDNASGSPQSVALLGSAVAGSAKLSAAQLTFASQSVGTTSGAQTVTLTNSGTVPLTLTSITVKGGQSDDFILAKTCGASLAVNSSCILSVTFKPVSVGAKQAMISIMDNVSGSPQSVALSGTGVAGSAKLSTSQLTFASQSVGTTSGAQTVTLTNNGAVALTLTSITVKGGQADDFNLGSACGASLAANASCVLSVTFKPVSVGAKQAFISILDNVSASPQSVALSGAGVSR
jgi:probable HAF family extracellular repeat protein